MQRRDMMRGAGSSGSGGGGAPEEWADSGAETAGSDSSRMSSSSEFVFEEGQDPFQMTVHLLANPGESRGLQKTLDCLLHWLSPDIQLFHVSERATPKKCCETQRRKKSGYPSLSVILFLHEDFGEERILQVHDFFQGPPWQYHHSESVGGKILPYMICCQDFYSLDANMPIWAVRQVHYGNEILRVTVCCSNENFEDSVKLYELILQKKAAVQKIDFCCFTVFSSQSFCIQLSLKQLPLGVPVNLKESAVLQFRVHAIGELVPLLPNPCIPISNTRWQTEDYDGNKILFQVKWLFPAEEHTVFFFELQFQEIISIDKEMAIPQYQAGVFSGIRRTNFVATNLNTNSEYLFRVRAVNVTGKGPWSQPYKILTVRGTMHHDMDTKEDAVSIKGVKVTIRRSS
ncbi:protein FAM124A isoform X4 [Chiloscyllium punctatum]|uniref:protein FAM124A isoform X4 n=1 Tax=Chiloscyllium punctatum TaxID=137246 RepID=UPI003B63B51F